MPAAFFNRTAAGVVFMIKVKLPVEGSDDKYRGTAAPVTVNNVDPTLDAIADVAAAIDVANTTPANDEERTVL